MVHVTGALPQYIPSPPISSFHVGPLDIRFYALGYIIGITLAILITRRRWRALGGDPDLVGDIALWAVPAGIIGGRIYFDITTPADIPHVWYGVFAVWTGGLGIWGGVALAAAVGVWRLRRLGITPGAFANAVAPGLLVAQAVGPDRELLQQGAVRRADDAAVGPGDPVPVPRRRRHPGAGPALRHLPADVPVRADLGPGARRLPGLARPPRHDQAVGAVRALRGRLLRVPHLRGVAADRLLRAFPRAAAEPVHRGNHDPGRACLVRRRAAPRTVPSSFPPCFPLPRPARPPFGRTTRRAQRRRRASPLSGPANDS